MVFTWFCLVVMCFYLVSFDFYMVFILFDIMGISCNLCYLILSGLHWIVHDFYLNVCGFMWFYLVSMFFLRGSHLIWCGLFSIQFFLMILYYIYSVFTRFYLVFIWLDTFFFGFYMCGFHRTLSSFHLILSAFQLILHVCYLILFDFDLILYGFHLTLRGFQIILCDFHLSSHGFHLILFGFHVIVCACHEILLSFRLILFGLHVFLYCVSWDFFGSYETLRGFNLVILGFTWY